jgi:hypothetical protein
MRVTFPRLPDHQRAYALVERDDGTVYRRYGGPAGPRLPPDIMHLVVERELRIDDGIWGGIAAGIDRSAELTAELRSHLIRAELLANLAECVAALDHPTSDQIRRLANTKLSVWPGAAVDPAAIAATASALQVEASRWARLRVGEELSYEWPAAARRSLRRTRARKPAVVRLNKGKGKGRGHGPGQAG